MVGCGEYPKVCVNVNLQAVVRYNCSVWGLFYGKKRKPIKSSN